MCAKQPINNGSHINGFMTSMGGEGGWFLALPVNRTHRLFLVAMNNEQCVLNVAGVNFFFYL